MSESFSGSVDEGAVKPSSNQTANAGTHPSAAPTPELEVAHVLFMDIVGYSLLHIDHQTQLLGQLQQVVSATAEYRKAQSAHQLISLPTGDGMALVFSGDPVAPVECAVAVSRALRKMPEIALRIGIHSGPVSRMDDINANRNVAGGGINMAQRVMDCGDAGHILLSRHMAEILAQLSAWAPHLHDLGEHVVKHGVRIHLFNLHNGEFGNPALPTKLTSAAPSKSVKDSSVARGRRGALLAAAVGLVILIAAGIWLNQRRQAVPPSATPPLAPREAFSYSVMVQRYENGRPYRGPFVLPGEMIFEQDYHIRLMISSPQPGYLYVLNEGPVTGANIASYNILFPGRDGPALLSAGQSIQIPAGAENWFVFDAQEGVEKLWLVWSTASVPILEQAKQFGDAEHRGAVEDSALIQKIQEFLMQQAASPSVAQRDEVNQKTTVSGNGNVVAKLVRLEHH